MTSLQMHGRTSVGTATLTQDMLRHMWQQRRWRLNVNRAINGARIKVMHPPPQKKVSFNILFVSML